jgi:DegV family protein with EDD domain
MKELVDLSVDAFYKRQRSGDRFSTSQPEPSAFYDVFKEAADAGDEVICITMSEGITGTINSANLAREMVGAGNISIIDSKGAGYGHAFLAMKARELADNGMPREEIVSAIKDIIGRTRTFFVVKSLQWLHEGGRLSGAQALIGTLIQIKPIIWFDPSGKMTAYEKVRTLKAAKARLLELVKERADKGVESAALHFTDNEEEAREFQGQMEEILKVPVALVKLAAVLGTHTGPEILGPCVITKS